MFLLTRASLKNRLIVGLITIAIAIVGLFSMGALKQELMPSMQMPVAYVSAQSPGLAPEEMSHTVTEPAEQALRAIPGVKKVSSSTRSGNAELTVEWPTSVDDDETMRAIRGASDTLKRTLPAGSEVQVFSGGSEDIPAMMLSAGTSGDPTEFADALQATVVPALQSVPGVQRVELAGRAEQRVQIALRPGDVTKHKVETAQLQPILESHGAAVPAGQADSKDGPLSVSVGTGITSIDDLKNLPVPTADGAVLLSDFADVTNETVPATTISRVNGKDALTLQVTPNRGANVVDISHGVHAELDRLAPGLKADFVPIFDQAPYIEQSIHDLSVEGALGLLFAVLVILAFLGSWRSTVIAAVSIPLSLLITLVGLWWSDNTLNILTLGALTIAIGRVVDDSIVVIENISRRRGTGPLTIEAVVASVRQVAGAITASTLTTVAVFLPIAFVSGIAGQLFRPFAVTVTIALLASLLVALTIVPVMAFWFLRNRPAKAHAAAPGAAGVAAGDPAAIPSELDEIHTAPDRLQRAIMPALNTTRRHPVITLVASALILVLTFVMSSLIKQDFLGSSGAESIRVEQTPASAKQGAPDTKELVESVSPIEESFRKIDGVRDVMTTIPLATPGEKQTVSYELLLDKGVDATVVTDAVEAETKRLPDAGELSVLTQDSFTDASGGGIALNIRGSDPTALKQASDLLEKQLKDAPGVRSVKSDISGDQPTMSVKLNQAKAAQLGFDQVSVAKAVQAALEGETIGKITLGGQDRDIVMVTPKSARSASELGEILLPVTPQQTAAAQKAASDRLQKKAEAEAEQARLDADAEITKQLNEAAAQRADLVNQLGQLNTQLGELSRAPIVPERPQSPQQQAQVDAQQQRAEQLAQLESAISGAQSGIEGMDEQIAALQKSRSDQAAQFEEQQAAEKEQKAATEVTGKAIPLRTIATVSEEKVAPVITRADGERQVTLSVTPKKGELEAANAAIAKATKDTKLPAGASFDVGGVSAEQDDAFAQLGAAMLAAILLVMIVMVATFRSFRGPFILLVSIPFAATGALLGLLVTGTPLGLPAMIGLLMLIGIVVTNAIVLMDLVNRLRAAGAPLAEAVEHGTRLRLRPILMTAAATIFALIPMSLGLTGGGVFISKPLAIVVIGGLISSTLLTLVLVPVLYTLVEGGRERRLARRADRAERKAAALAGMPAPSARSFGSSWSSGAAKLAPAGAEAPTTELEGLFDQRDPSERGSASATVTAPTGPRNAVGSGGSERSDGPDHAARPGAEDPEDPDESTRPVR
ncbi:efflux RND transporter permease subunit [Leucobacter sp. CSA2]|uniref:Efflux RND transporter permease subunit n=1 Tax=Leucobacter edaphi TaxID=2796472 RepID=A0A934QDQ8_9MICO|nr:efflux RND transporter permease subunit [Leucobacter edaphi]MBK0421936.1 efflux RND transporter permease subunit [Leucobacter edaphi]